MSKTENKKEINMIDEKLINLVIDIDNIQVIVGQKWAALVYYCIEAKLGRENVKESLIQMGKTEASAEATTAYVMKLIAPKNRSLLAMLRSGNITVSEARRDINEDRKID